MDEKEKPKSVFPPEYAFLEDSLRTTQGRLLEIDQRIANLLQDRGHRLNFRPPGDYKVNDRGKQLFRKEELERDKEKVKEEYQQSTDVRIKYASPEQKAQIREMVDHHLSDNRYKNQEPAELKKQQKDEKTTSQSFDFISAQYFAKYGTIGSPLKPEESIIHDPKYNIDQMGERFLNKLSYSKQNETMEQDLTQAKEKQETSYQSLIGAKEREERDIDKE